MEDPLVRAMAAAYRTSRGGAALQRRAGRDRRDLSEHVGRGAHRHHGSGGP